MSVMKLCRQLGHRSLCRRSMRCEFFILEDALTVRWTRRIRQCTPDLSVNPVTRWLQRTSAR